MRPLQTSSLPTRSNDIDLLSKHRATCQSGAEEQLVLVNSPSHGGIGEARATIAIEVDGGADSLVVAGKPLLFGQGNVYGAQKQLQNCGRVVAEALVSGARVPGGHARDDQRFVAEGERSVGRFEGGHAAVAEGGFA